MLPKLKQALVRLLGRETANNLTAPYYDWQSLRRTRRTLLALPGKDLCIHIGCGSRTLPGWVNLDAARGDKVDVVWDLQRGLPFPSESCATIFGEHVIEHLSKADGQRLIKECHRVLQPGGVLRLSTPDAERFLRSYVNDGEFLDDPRFPDRAETHMDRVNMMMREHGQHLWVYDAQSLVLLLQKTGFGSASPQEFGTSSHPRMQGIDSAERAFESLYVEGIK